MNKKNKIKHSVLFVFCFVAGMCLAACGTDHESTTEQERTITIPTEESLIEKDGTVEEDVSTTEITTEEKKQESAAQTDEELEAILNQQMEERIFTGDCSIGVVNLISKTTAVVDNHSMQAASLIKLYIAGAVYENLDNGTITGSENTDALISKMITVSDNNAANDLVTLLGNQDIALGMERVNQYCQTHGFCDTHMGRLLLAPNDDDDNYTSVNDILSFLSQVYEGNLSGSVDILSYMKSQERTSKLPAGIPDGVVTANKTGELSDVENDAMIVLTEKKPYVICVMGQYLSAAGDARTWMTDLSGKVYEYTQQN